MSSIFIPQLIDNSSFRAGGATHLIVQGVPSELVQKMGRWKSDAWDLYICTHPALLAVAIQGSTRSSSLTQSLVSTEHRLNSLFEMNLRLGDQLTHLTKAWERFETCELDPVLSGGVTPEAANDQFQ
jgi:hypothetical protein